MAEKGMLIQWSKSNDVKLKCRLDLGRLFDPITANRFADRYREFLKDDVNKKIYRRKGNQLFYDSEQLIPPKRKPGTPILLVLGNPASISVHSGMFFANKDKRPDHRFWRIIEDLDNLRSDDLGAQPSVNINQIRKQKMLGLGLR